MKTVISIIALAFLLGCATFNDNAGKVLATTAQTVDSGMKAWGVYVAAKHIPPPQQMGVRKAYGNYQLAMAAAEKAYIEMVKTGDRSGWLKARDAMTASQSSLIALIQSITKATK